MSLLLEVVLGFGIFAACLLLIMGLFPTSHRAMTIAKNHAIASALARQYIDEYSIKSYNSPTLVSMSSPNTVVWSTVVNGQPVTQDFSYMVSVTPNSPSAGVKDVRVVVQWYEGTPGGGSNAVIHQVELETYVSAH